MKYVILLIFLVCSIESVYTQNKSFTTFRDYLTAASNPDSSKKVERTMSPDSRSSQSLHVLIATELRKQNWNDPMDIQDTKQIGQMAAKQKSQIGLAMTYFILGRHYSYEKEDSLSYDYLVKAEKIFTKNRDTTGMLYCYRQLRLSVHENYIDLAKQYFNKLIALSTKSSNPVDKYFYYLSVLSADPYFEKQPTEPQLLDAFNKAAEMINKYPYCEFMRRNIYHNFQQGYVYLNKYDKALDVALQTIRHPKIKADYMDYQNLGRCFIWVKKFDDAIVALEKAAKEIKTASPTDFRRQRNIYKLLKTAYYNVGNWKSGVKADEEYDRLNEIIFESDRSLAMFHLKEKYSFTEKEAELKRISLEKQIVESRNKLLAAEKREAALKNLALENQATESNTKLIKTQMEVAKKEGAIKLADSQKRLLFGGLMMTLAMVGIVLFFSIRLGKTNTKLRTLQVARDKFYTIIAHDLRSPLNSLNDMGTLLQNLIREGKKQELDKVIQQIESMRQQTNLLLNNLIEWGKTSNYEVITKQQVFDGAQAVNELYNSHKVLTEAKGITMSIEMQEELELNADPNSFVLILRNLLDNALKYTSKGGFIKVFSEKTGNQISIHVKDSGQGMPAEQLNYIQRVFAGKIKPEVGEQGLGLGIILIHDFARKNNAILRVTSEVGVGSCFSLVF